MKTLLESTDTSATYQFTLGTTSRTVTYTRSEEDEVAPDFSAMATADYEAWASWIGTPDDDIDPLDVAEAHISKYFSTSRLLQLKDWRDTFPEEDAPMLEETYDWLNAVTIQAAQGQTTFAEPPHMFEELVAEAMFILGVEQP